MVVGKRTVPIVTVWGEQNRFLVGNQDSVGIVMGLEQLIVRIVVDVGIIVVFTVAGREPIIASFVVAEDKHDVPLAGEPEPFFNEEDDHCRPAGGS